MKPWIQPTALSALLAAGLLAACSGDELALDPLGGAFGSREQFGGIVAADEPRAAVVGRDVLEAGGNAADAAAALYFALAVTLPSSASLGGGGVCLVHDPEEKKVEVIDFMPRAAPAGGIAVPGNVRGMGALHARFGTLPWPQILAPAEQMARLGAPASRALTRELATTGESLLQDPGMRATFAPAGHLLEEGEPLQQIELGAVLAQIRQNGAGAFNSGPLASSFVDAVNSIGVPLSADAMRAMAPQFLDPLEIAVGDHLLAAPQLPAAGGPVALLLIQMLTEGRDYAAADESEKPHLLAEAMKRVFADRARWMRPDGSSAEAGSEIIAADRAVSLMEGYSPDQPTPVSALPTAPVGGPENPWATGFVVVDRNDRAVACNFTMNELFGSGRMAPGMGIVLAAAPGANGASAADLGPLMVFNANTGTFFYAAAGSGGTTAPTAMAQVFLHSWEQEQPLAAAVAARRLHHNGEPDIVFHEPGESQAAIEALERRGHRTESVEIIGRVNAVWCSGGIRLKPETCQAAADPRGDGLALLLLSEEGS